MRVQPRSPRTVLCTVISFPPTSQFPGPFSGTLCPTQPHERHHFCSWALEREDGIRRGSWVRYLSTGQAQRSAWLCQLDTNGCPERQALCP